MLRDISTHKEIQKRNAEFVSSVSHEMKTPLAGIKAYLELLVDGDAEDEETCCEFLEIIGLQADRLQRLVENLLNIARIEAGVVSVSYDTFSGSADAGTDFQARSGVVSFDDADSGARGLSVPIIDDDKYEGDETFTVALSDPQGGVTLGPITELTVTIRDNDPPPELMFRDGFE